MHLLFLPDVEKSNDKKNNKNYDNNVSMSNVIMLASAFVFTLCLAFFAFNVFYWITGWETVSRVVIGFFTVFLLLEVDVLIVIDILLDDLSSIYISIVAIIMFAVLGVGNIDQSAVNDVKENIDTVKEFSFTDKKADDNTEKIVENIIAGKSNNDAISSEKTTSVKEQKITVSKVLPSVSGSIVKQKSTGNIYDIYINVDGRYDYYEYEYYEASSDGEVSLIDSGTEYQSSFRVSGFSVGIPYMYANIIPYNDDGTSGKEITVRLHIDTNSKQPTKNNSTITSCNKLGLINCHGGTVAGFATSYVAKGGVVEKVHSSLGDGWHIVAYNTCTSNGDYYGWVDSNYIDFN